MSHPGVPPTSPPLGWAQQPPPPPQRDSTRTIAIVALVVGSLALLGQMLTMVLPMLFFGLLGFGGGFIDEEFPPSGGTSFGGGQVSPAADGTISAAAMTAAVRGLVDVDDAFMPPVDEITCDAVPRVARDVSVLCRATPADWYYIVRFVDGSGEFDVLVVEHYEDWMP